MIALFYILLILGCFSFMALLEVAFRDDPETRPHWDAE